MSIVVFVYCMILHPFNLRFSRLPSKVLFGMDSPSVGSNIERMELLSNLMKSFLKFHLCQKMIFVPNLF